MKVWSIQPLHIYEKIMKTGTYRCDGRYVEKSYREPYKWLVEKMTEKIGPAPKDIKYPVWAWHTRDGKHKKPDLRHNGYGNRGEEMVCMELEIPDNKIVLTDFEAWHFVLNCWYLNVDCLDEETWEKDKKMLLGLSYEERQKKIRESWNGIFDISRFQNSWVSRGYWVQATFWEIKKENMVSVRHFKAR